MFRIGGFSLCKLIWELPSEVDNGIDSDERSRLIRYPDSDKRSASKTSKTQIFVRTT